MVYSKEHKDKSESNSCELANLITLLQLGRQTKKTKDKKYIVNWAWLKTKCQQFSVLLNWAPARTNESLELRPKHKQMESWASLTKSYYRIWGAELLALRSIEPNRNRQTSSKIFWIFEKSCSPITHRSSRNSFGKAYLLVRLCLKLKETKYPTQSVAGTYMVQLIFMPSFLSHRDRFELINICDASRESNLKGHREFCLVLTNSSKFIAQTLRNMSRHFVE